MSDALAERIVRRAMASLASSHSSAPARASAARDMLVSALRGDSQPGDAADGYAAAIVLQALARAVEAEAGSGLDWLAVAALGEWDFRHPDDLG